MQTVGLKTLKNKLSAYVRAAAAGETVLITDRDRVVAEIVPPRSTKNTTRAEMIEADLVRRGLMTPAKHRLERPPPRIGSVPFDELMRELDADRSDR